mmetsp:Transcript_48118/g.120296  ORF Transcript_48118/g.120296 Transcript_48118/m.120296 type:complete len:306 (+) Transcript_48118:1-918(+)
MSESLKPSKRETPRPPLCLASLTHARSPCQSHRGASKNHSQSRRAGLDRLLLPPSLLPRLAVLPVRRPLLKILGQSLEERALEGVEGGAEDGVACRLHEPPRKHGPKDGGGVDPHRQLRPPHHDALQAPRVLARAQHNPHLQLVPLVDAEPLDLGAALEVAPSHVDNHTIVGNVNRGLAHGAHPHVEELQLRHAEAEVARVDSVELCLVGQGDEDVLLRREHHVLAQSVPLVLLAGHGYGRVDPRAKHHVPLAPRGGSLPRLVPSLGRLFAAAHRQAPDPSHPRCFPHPARGPMFPQETRGVPPR